MPLDFLDHVDVMDSYCLLREDSLNHVYIPQDFLNYADTLGYVYEEVIL